MRFGFLVTARCNAACTHCTTSCGPHETAALAATEITGLMDQAAAIWKRDRFANEPLSFSISGGEPFLDFPLLLEVVAHGARLGASLSCVTNGYWAASDAAARQKLAQLEAAGLRGLAVSTSRFHQQFVKVSRVERALRIARELGVRTTLKCAVLASDQGPGGLDRWARAAAVDELEVFPVVPYLRDGAALPQPEYVRGHRLPEGGCPAATITVREDGTAYTCCIPGGFVEFLALGNTRSVPLEDIYRRFYLQGRQQVLRHKGPSHFAQAIIARGEGHRLRASYESVCDLCAHIAGDPAMAAIADEVSLRFARAERRRLSRQLARRAVSSISAVQGGQSHEEEATAGAAP